MSRKNNYGFQGYPKQGRKGNMIFWVFFGILAFACIYFPFFGQNLRYQVGNFVSDIFSQMGYYIFMGGSFCMAFAFLSALSKKFGKCAKFALIGGAMILLGLWFWNPGLLAGLMSFGQKPFSRGYY